MNKKHEKTKAVAEVAAHAIVPGYGMFRAIQRSMNEVDEAAESGNEDKMKREAIEQEFRMSMIERQAKAAQEIAIAGRIMTADEVEVEEFYETNGEGKLGLSADEKAIGLGLSGKGNKVTKRVYRFKGSKDMSAKEEEVFDLLLGGQITSSEN